MTQRLGVMGGMFDPVHRGHLQVAETARDELALDRVHLVPCLQPNHREPAKASSQQRLAMLRLAVAGIDRLLVDERELRRGGVSYMVDTLASLRQDFPAQCLVLILGMDSFASLPGWHRWQQLFELCHFLVVTRPGSSLPMGSEIGRELERRQVFSAEAMFATTSGAVMVCTRLLLDVSSSEIRRRLAVGDPVADLVPQSVAEYISEHKLYHTVQ